MSVPRGLGQNGGHFYSNITTPVEIDCNFIVDSTNGNGLGIRSLKSNGYIRNVFMNTSASPGTNKGATNPNPVAGYAYIQFENNFNAYLGGFSGFVSPLTSTSTTALTQHHVYVITSLGTTTTAQWVTAGLTPGFTPAVGAAFIAAATASLSGTGTVGLPSAGSITAVAVAGDPNATDANTTIAQNGGALVMVQFLAATNTTTTTLVASAPADGTTVALSFKFDRSSVTIDGL